MSCLCFVFVFFFKQKTAYEMRISDWSSDVCSSDLIQAIWTADFRRLETHYNDQKFTLGSLYIPVPELVTLVVAVSLSLLIWAAMRYTDLGKAQIGRASCRERVCQYV